MANGSFVCNDWDNATWIGYENLPDSMKVVPGVHGNGDTLGNTILNLLQKGGKKVTISKTADGKYCCKVGSGLYNYKMAYSGN